MDRPESVNGAGPALGPWPGVYPALVADVKDPDGQGRVKVSLPMLPDAAGAHGEAWARVATLMAGPNRGSWFMPDVGDEVLVAFQGGDPRVPYVIGALWNGRDTPPVSMDGAGHNDVKVLRTRSGLELRLSDLAGQESLTLRTPSGNTLKLKDGPAGIVIEDASGNAIRMDATGVYITAVVKVSISTSELNVSAASAKLDVAVVKCSGKLMAETMVANSMVAGSYTPAAGNIW